MSRTIEISDKTFAVIDRRARKAGIEIDLLIEKTFKEQGDKLKNGGGTAKALALSEAMKDFVGAAARLPLPEKRSKRTPFGEILVRKYRKQGLQLDHDID